jgi:hypothetical protein
MKKGVLLVISLSLITTMMSGCIAMFAPSYQTVNIKSATPGATIKSYSSNSTSKNVLRERVNKKMYFQGAIAEKEGYKTRYYGYQLTKLSPWTALALPEIIVPFPGLVFLITDLANPKKMKYDKEQVIPSLVSYDIRKEHEKYLLVNKTSIDLKNADMTYKYYLNMRGFNRNTSDEARARELKKASKMKSNFTNNQVEDIKVNNTIFTESLNDILKKMNFVDTTNTIFPNYGNSLYIDGTVKKIRFHIIGSNGSTFTFEHNLVAVEMDIDWSILDYYKQPVYNVHTNKISDLILIDVNNKNISQKINEIVEDNMEYALLDIRKELSTKGYLNVEKNKSSEKYDALNIAKPTIAEGTKMNEFLKSSVTVKVDDGHGSGIIISQDGYILTNYHVIAGSKNIEVILTDGTKLPATVVRKNTEVDLVLLQVKRTDLSPLPISEITEPEIGVEVWTIGTPKSIELGQTVSKGILSGIRKANGLSYLQTDVSLNTGNSGGAMITKDGTIIGIVTSKLIGIGTEGVGFAIPSSEIFSKLNIQYTK